MYIIRTLARRLLDRLVSHDLGIPPLLDSRMDDEQLARSFGR